MKARAWLSLLVLTACSRGSAKRADSAAADTGMADMAGMDMPAEVRFTAAQVTHGGVHWEPVVLGTVASSAILPGQVVPNEDRTARLGATVPGRVLAVRVGPGDRVRKGDVLVTLQSPAAGLAQADVAKAVAELSSRRAQAAYARSARDRAERLLTLKAIPRQDYDRAVADDELAAAAFAQAEAELRRAQNTAEQIGADASASGEIGVRSPLNGVVLARTAAPGTVIDAGAPLVIVTDPSGFWLSVDAPEKLASLFRIGGRLRFTVPAYPADTFSAQIQSVGAGLDPSTRTLPVRGVIVNRDGRLKPEMLASVMVDGGAPASSALVPEDAVQLLDGKSVVFVAHPAGDGGVLFMAHDVELGSRSGGRVAVVRGLAEGDLIVTRGALAVKAQIKKGSMPEMVM